MRPKKQASTMDLESQLAALNTLISATHTWIDMQTFLAAALEQAVELADADAGECHLVNARGELEFAAHYHLDPDFAAASKSIRFSPGEGLPGWVYACQEAVYVPQIETESRYKRKDLAARAGYRSLACLPLSGMDALLGTFILYYRQAIPPIQDLQKILTVIGQQMGIAIERARLVQQTKKQLGELQILQAVSNALNRSINIQDALERSLEAVATAMGLPCGWVVLMDGDLGVRIAASYNLPPEVIPEDWAAMQTPCHCLDLLQKGLLKSAANIVECQRLGRLTNHAYPYRHHASIPLRAGEAILGNLNLVTEGDRAFSDDELMVLTAVGDQISVAIERAMLYEETRERRIREQLTLLDHSRTLLGKGKAQTILEQTLQITVCALQADHAALALIDPGGKTYSVKAGVGRPAKRLAALQSLSLEEETPISRVIREKTPLALSDTRREPLCGQGEGCEGRPAAMLVVPMLTNDQPLGAILLHSDTVRVWNQDDIRLLSLLANQTASAIENARLFESLSREQHNTAQLYRLSLELAGNLDPAAVARRALQVAAEAAGAQRGNVLAVESDGVTMRLLAVTGYDRETVEEINARLQWTIHRGVTGRVARSGKAAIIADVARDPDWVTISGLDDWVRSMLSVPLVAGNKVVGALNLLSEQPDSFKADHLAPVSAIASAVALALQNASLYEGMQQRVRELEILADASSTLRKARSPEEMPLILLAHAAKGLNAHAGVLFLLEDGELKCAATHGPAGVPVGETCPPDVLILWQVASMGKAVFITDVTQRPELHQRPACRALMGEARSCVCVPLQTDTSTIGVLFLNWKKKARLSAEESRLLGSLAEIAANALQRSRLHVQTERQALELTLAYDATIEGWSRALDLRDRETEGHTQRVTELTLELARQMGLPESALIHIRRGALLHDIGKLGIPDSILHKPGPLNEEERALMRLHPQFAHDMLSPIAYLQPALDIPWCHHEKWDGSGYPRGLKGEEIPLAARIFAVADVFDALTADRPYRPAWTKRKALAYIRREAGRCFDPKITDMFLKINSSKNTPHVRDKRKKTF